MSLDSLLIIVFLAGLGAGIGFAIVVGLSRDLPWALRIIYRFLRYHRRPSRHELPPSIKPYHQAIVADLRRRERS